MGGLLGALLTNPRKALEDTIDKGNQEGWNAIHIEPHGTINQIYLGSPAIGSVFNSGPLDMGVVTWFYSSARCSKNT